MVTDNAKEKKVELSNTSLQNLDCVTEINKNQEKVSVKVVSESSFGGIREKSAW